MSGTRIITGPDPLNRIVTFVISFILTTPNNLGRLINNVFHYRRATVGSDPIKSDLASTLDTAVLASMFACLAQSDSVPYNIGVRYLDDALDPQEDHAGTQPWGGTAGDRLPLTVCATVQLQTGIRGRSYRGSKHLCPIAEGDSSMDQGTVGFKTNLDTFATNCHVVWADSNGNLWQPIVVSAKQSQSIINQTSLTVSDITAGAANIKLGTMRHRKEKG